MKIHFYNRQKDFPLSKHSIGTIVNALSSFLSISCDEVALYFVTEKKISNLHLQFFNDPSPTDCITFPLDDSYLGEIFVCPAVALSYAKKRGLDPFEEVVLYLVHGFLHLIGYDDIDPKKRAVMRKKEKACMRYLRTKGFF